MISKECLMKLFYLYNKSTKKVRSLKELIDEFDGLMDLTDNFIEYDCVAPIRVYRTRLTEYFVKALQLVISKFEIYLTYIENFGKKGKKAETKSEVFGCQQIVKLSIHTRDGILFRPADVTERTFVELAREVSYNC